VWWQVIIVGADEHVIAAATWTAMPQTSIPQESSSDIEEFKPQAARLAVDLCLDRRPARDKRGIADHSHHAVRKARAATPKTTGATSRRPRWQRLRGVQGTHWLEYDSIALATLVIGIGIVILIALSI